MQKRILDDYPERVNEDWNRMPFVPGFHVHLKNMKLRPNINISASDQPALHFIHIPQQWHTTSLVSSIFSESSILPKKYSEEPLNPITAIAADWQWAAIEGPVA